jgi:cell division transport system permease protein
MECLPYSNIFLYFWPRMSNDQFISTKVKKGKATYVYSIIGVALVLFLLGSLGYMVINVGQLSKTIKENIEIAVIFNDNTRNEMGLKLKSILDKQSFIKSSDFITKEMAAEICKKDLGEDYSAILDYNPLFSSINLHLHSQYMNKDSLIKIENFIMQSNIVREVSYKKNLVDIMNSNVKRVGIVILFISLFLIFSVIILIDNTIRLAMFSNRFLIKTMQMVGATRWFIAKPFNIRGVLNGIISSLLAIAGILLLKIFAESWLPELRNLQINRLLFVLCFTILTMGIVISLLSTHRSVIKYLRTQLDDLY